MIFVFHVTFTELSVIPVTLISVTAFGGDFFSKQTTSRISNAAGVSMTIFRNIVAIFSASTSSRSVFTSLYSETFFQFMKSSEIKIWNFLTAVSLTK